MASLQVKDGIILTIGRFKIHIKADGDSWVVILYDDGEYWDEILDVSLSGARCVISNIQFYQMMRVT
jgi:hypothetical protein